MFGCDLPLQGLLIIAILVERLTQLGSNLGVESRKLMGELRKGVERPKNEAHKWPLVRFSEAAEVE